MIALKVEEVREDEGYGLFNLNLLSGKGSSGILNPGRYSLFGSSKSLGYLKPTRYSLTLNSKLPKTTFLNSITTQRTLMKTAPKRSFLSSVGSWFSNLFQKTQPVLQTYLQYKIMKDQLKWQAKLAQAQSGGYYPPPGGQSYPPPATIGQGLPQADMMAPAYPSPRNDTSKYLLLGGAALVGVLLVMMMKRD